MSPRDPGTNEREESTEVLLAALRELVRPIARLMIEKQITFSMLAELVKEVLIEVASDDFAIGDRKLTDSRLSLLTGIHRKDVKRLRRDLAGGGSPSRSASLGALLVSRWMGDPDYLDLEGRPLDLPRVAVEEGSPSFETLVFSASKDIPVRSVLDEWIRAGVAELDDEADVVRLCVESFVPEEGFDDKVYFFGRNLRDHAAAGVHNLLAEGDPFFDRSVFYDRLSAESLAELRRVAADVGARALREINRLALGLQQRDAPRPEEETRHRMSWGAYFFGADEGPREDRIAPHEERRDDEE